MTHRWTVVMSVVALAAAVLGGCGVSVSPEATPSARPSAASTASPTAVSPEPAKSSAPPASPAPSLSPSPDGTPVPQPTGARDPEALAAAIRRVEAAARVRLMLPQFDQLATGMVARSGVPGAVIAVVAGDRAVYVRCFGLRAIGRPEVVDKDTLFPLGSVSQTYTATMLAALAGEGEVGWDEPVRRVWPGFRLQDPWASREATFRDLMAQRTGLPAGAGNELLDFGYGRAEVLRRLRYLPPAAGFRTVHTPQDTAVTAAAVAAEKATGLPWVRLVRTRVLEPLGATATALTYREFMTATNRATPHRILNGSLQPQRPAEGAVFAPARGVGASVAELVPYVRMLLNGGALGGVRVAPAAALAETLAPTTVVSAGDAGPETFALGWRTFAAADRLVAQAEGDLERGSAALLGLVPADGVAIIVLANSAPEGGMLARALSRTLLDLYGPGAPRDDWLVRERELTEAEAEAQALADPRGSGPCGPAPQPRAGAAAPRQRSAYEGVYRDRYYGDVTVGKGLGDGLRVRLGRGLTLRYVPWDGDTWREVGSSTTAVFTVRDGRATRLRLALLTFDGRDGTFVRRR